MNITYAPSITALFDAFDDICDTQYQDNQHQNNYVNALEELGVISRHDGMFYAGDSWEFMRQLIGEERRKAFADQLQKTVEGKAIVDVIAANVALSVQNVKERIPSMPSSTVDNILLWLTDLHILTLSGTSFTLYVEDAEEEVDSEDTAVGSDEINIKEDKYSVYEYLRKIKRNDIVLNPDFQRNLVWKADQKSQFIESALMSLPLPPIFLKKISDKKFIVVDGLQRSAALRDFINNDFELSGLNTLKDLNGCRFSDLDSRRDGLSARLEDRQLNMYVMQPSVPMAVVYDVFNRINTGGTQLTRQEIRNCVFQGHSTKLLKELSENFIFKESIGYGIKHWRMKDREVLLRCMAFVLSNYDTDYNGSMDEYLEQTMIKLNRMSDSEIETLKQKTLKVLQLTTSIFGDRNFRIPTECTRGRINIAVMETVFWYFFKFHDDEVGSPDNYKSRYKQLLADESYLNAVRWSTGSKSQVKIRFDKAMSYLSKL